MTDDDRKMRHAHVSSSRFTSGRLSNYAATRTQFRRTSSRNNRARAPDLEARVGRSRRRLARSGSLRFRLPPIERMRASTRGALAPFHQRKSARAGLRRKRRARVSFSGRRERERGGPYPSPEAFSTSPQGLDCFLFPSTRAHMAARHIRPSSADRERESAACSGLTPTDLSEHPAVCFVCCRFERLRVRGVG